LDHVFVKLNEDGNICDLMVGESKADSGQLGTTKDGRQMGNQWRTSRIRGLAKRYRELADNIAGIERLPMPHGISSNQIMNVPLKSQGDSGVFWRESSTDAWKLDTEGVPEEKIERQLRGLANYLQSAADGKITYRSRVFEVRLEGDWANVTVRNVEIGDELPSIRNLERSGEFRVRIKASDLSGNSLRKILIQDLQRRNPGLSPSHASEIADELIASESVGDLLKPTSLWSANSPARSVLHVGLASAALGGIAEEAIRLFHGESFNSDRFLKTSLASGLGGSAGRLAELQSVEAMMQSAAFRDEISKVAARIGLRNVGSEVFVRGIGTGVGVSVGGGVISYGLYFLGQSSLEEANRGAIASVAGGLGTAVTGPALFGIASTFGTASTGTAISSLSGAAATNASLAWMGGGAASAGGGGMAGGTFMVAASETGVGIVIVAAVMVGYHFFDQGQEADRLRFTIDWLEETYAATP
jgi:hypothetical protein